MKDMSITKVLEKLPVLQRLMDRILGCRPTGAAKTNRLVQIALYPLVRESYHLTPYSLFWEISSLPI